MPGDGGYFNNQFNKATIEAQLAAEKAAAAAAKKAAAPKYIPRDQRVQTGPQPAPNFTPNAANMDLVNRAYGNIGRAGVGTNLNQIDQGGQNYWMNQLNSGAISPQDFAANFAGAAQIAQPETANMYQNQALSQIRGARPSGEAQQFYQPVYQSQQTNYATTNPLDASQYGTPMTARSLVDSAYAGIGRYGSGNQTNQVDPGGRQFWESQLASGSLNPQSLFSQFSNAVNQARQTPGDRYGQYYQNQTGYGGGYQGYMPQMQSPFRYQQPAQQMNWQTGQMMQPAQPQMQTPFSYQQPTQQMQQPMAQTNYGPSQAIVGRSSQMRGTPSVMRRAEGGITSLLKKDK